MPIQLVINKARVPVKVWTKDAEPAAIDQVVNTANLPFVFKHVAAMADIHAGRGATVGTVIATKGAIIPAAVGVDIGCFTGDTKVSCLDGKEYSLEELTDKGTPCYVYAVDSSGEITASVATAKKTREQAVLVEVTLDNAEKIRCTPDHEFMLRDGTYRQAKDLLPNDSLMPLYKKIDKDGYIRISLLKRKWQKQAHWVVAHAGLLGKLPDARPQRLLLHHKDFNKQNNLPSNLTPMGNQDHSALHRQIVGDRPYWNGPEFTTKRLAGIQASKLKPAVQVKRAIVGSANFRKYMSERPEHFARSVAGNGIHGKGYLSKYNMSEKGRAKSKEVANRFYPCGICDVHVKSGLGVHNHRKGVHKVNHKVVSVVLLDYREDVYCLTVPKYGNFALATGVFVHNCGMMAVKTPLDYRKVTEKLSQIRHSIERSVPVGREGNRSIEKSVAEWSGWHIWKNLAITDNGMQQRASSQLGSLGGGNHFIEICLDTENNVWVMLHSGSRNIGKSLAEVHIDKAKGLMKQMFVSLPDPDLAYLVDNTPEFYNYVNDLNWAQDYAFQNRKEMMTRVLKDLAYAVNEGQPFERLFEVNCHHNYVARENHFGENVLVTRKGAVRARVGDYGIIPGSMGTKSFIVEGLGNPESFDSCSHGAGRRMSRSRARATFTAQDLIDQTVGVECRKDSAVIDEIPGAYKDIDQVMANQRDLVKVKVQLKQILCIKG